MPEIELYASGMKYGGWIRAEITRSIEAVAGAFKLTVSGLGQGEPAGLPIKPGDECKVTVGGETVITGHVDDVEIAYDAGRHDITVAGRDATGDLVDCSIVMEGGEWKNRVLYQIAVDICGPFGIGVVTNAPVGMPFDTLRHQKGETAFELLERAARMRGVLMTSDGLGNLVITGAGEMKVFTVLERGVNILAAKGLFSQRERFSGYIVIGQKAGNNLFSGTAASEIVADADDNGVKRYRPLIIQTEEPGDARALKERAEWERNVRAGRANRITYTVAGWEHDLGLWRPNELVTVRDSWMGLDGETLLIGTVKFIIDEKGSRTELVLAPKAAFTRMTLPDEKELAPSVLG